MKRPFRILIPLIVPCLLAIPAVGQEDNVSKLESESKAAKEAAGESSNAAFVVRMKNNKFLRGVPLDFPMLDVYILGTKIPVPVDQIVGVRFPANPEEKGTVALKNGEMLSGRIDPPKVVLSVEWGEAAINPSMLTAMVRDGSMQWSVRNTPNGPQWFLAPRLNRSSSLPNQNQSTSRYVTVPPVAPISSTASSDRVTPISYTNSGQTSSNYNASEFSWIW